ncbi:MAG: hypothetical protein K8R25_15445 [Methanosarcinales archaeon]|nr:hypothetical protein [Methanosarcinales archaeon]
MLFAVAMLLVVAYLLKKIK